MDPSEPPPPIDADIYITSLDVLVRGYVSSGTSSALPTETVALLHREAFDMWTQANAHDSLCYEAGYLSFDEAAARAIALQTGMASVMNDRHGLRWPVPALPDDDDRLFDEARKQLHATNPRDMDPQVWAECRARYVRQRRVRDTLVRASGIGLGGASSAFALLRVPRAPSAWPLREQDAPLFVDTSSDDEDDAQFLTEWDVVARVKTDSKRFG